MAYRCISAVERDTLSWSLKVQVARKLREGKNLHLPPPPARVIGRIRHNAHRRSELAYVSDPRHRCAPVGIREVALGIVMNRIANRVITRDLRSFTCLMVSFEGDLVPGRENALLRRLDSNSPEQ